MATTVSNIGFVDLWYGGATPPFPAATGGIYVFPETGVTTPVVAPVVSNWSPAVSSSIGPTTALSFDVTDEDGSAGLRRMIVVLSFPSYKVKEIVFDGDGFGPQYTNPSNTQASIAGGYRFTILRDSGWLESPVITPYVLDITGAEAV